MPRVTFDAHAKGGELGVGDVKRALVDFGIYFSHAQTDRAVRIVVPASKANRVLDFEGDECDGDDAPAKVRTFATFVLVLSAIEGHQQRAFSETSTSFADEPRSKQIDEVAFACERRGGKLDVKAWVKTAVDKHVAKKEGKPLPKLGGHKRSRSPSPGSSSAAKPRTPPRKQTRRREWSRGNRPRRPRRRRSCGD